MVDETDVSQSSIAQTDIFQSDPQRIRSTSELSRLFSKGTVNGEELINELLAIQAASRAADTQKAFNNLMGAVDKTKINYQTAKKIDWTTIFKTTADAGLKHVQTTINHKALDQFIDTMVEDRSALARETIKLPSPQGLTAGQQQRVLNMAAFVIGARVANQVADDAFNTLENLEDEYKQLLRRREEIAGVLADIVARRNEAKQLQDELAFRQRTAELRQHLSEEDLAFIDRFGTDRPITEFANDFAMQNLAIRFLQGRDPERYKDYRADVDGLVGRTKVAVKTAGGAVAFGGLVMSFAHEVSSFGDVQNTGVIVEVMPLGLEFVTAAAPLAGKVAKTAITGIVIEPGSLIPNPFGPKRFRVTVAEGKENDLRSAKKVFDTIEENNENDRFESALFTDGGQGWLIALYRCDPDTVGRMLDASVSKGKRNEFGVKFMEAPESKDYSFVNALTDNDMTCRERLVRNVLGRDQRRRPQYPIVGETQQEVSLNFKKWNNSQLTRMILANHHGSVEYAQMQIGSMMIRLIPSMTAVYEYEAYADSVRNQANMNQASIN
ncbi:hypothetical protein DSCO28_65810 [Desulfosarcina ovata subsp. sediminis]|uniref:Uncharacterized protein n=1 Tax=Desulfosarcina ovata subsp. sediminis TaxID=885957 RepID=A0A5K8A0E3_9BACT|nr:hypothetical protein [Desulfosarcina ovata]BBO86015.1 hypothetical protein DSCO28_65810 [Desulfosarcina ovata subsp. sediminis]